MAVAQRELSLSCLSCPKIQGLSSHKLIISSLHSIVRWYAKELGVKLNKFIMDDINTFYLVHGLRKKTYAVNANPDILKYKLPKSERGMSANQLLQQALQKVLLGRGKEGVIQYI